jgi:hypothetical protein
MLNVISLQKFYNSQIQKKMKKILGILSIASIVFLASCGSGITVSYDYDKEADFSKYKKFEYYGWADNSDKILSDLDKRRIESAFADEFEKRGITFVEGDGDAVVSLFIVVNQETSVTAYTDHYNMGGAYGPYGYGPGWGWGYGTSTTRYQENDYLVGTLVVDVFDKAERKLIWQGVGQKTVDDNSNTAVKDKNVQKAAQSIMINYPVKPIEEDK